MKLIRSPVRMAAAAAESERIRLMNIPLADALTKLYGTPVRNPNVGDGDMHEGMGIEHDVKFLANGGVEPSSNVEGNVVFAMRPNFIDTTPELARRLFSAMADILAAKLAAKPAV